MTTDWTEDQCLKYLTDVVARYGERLVVEPHDGRWGAQLRFPNPWPGEQVPLGAGTAVLPDEGVRLGVDGCADRLTAMRELTRLAQNRDQRQ